MKIEIIAILMSLIMATGSIKEEKTRIETTLRPAEEPQVKYVTKQRDILEGLNGIGVVVEAIKPDVEEYGVTQQTLQSHVELQLRQYGIRVLTRKERIQTAGSPYLYVNIDSQINQPFGDATLHIGVTLREETLLVRRPTLCVTSITWETSGVVLAGKKRMNMIKEAVKYQVDIFINDYLAAHQKLEPQKEKARVSAIDRIPDDKMTWVKCNNPECQAEYQMSLKAYYQTIEKRLDPRSLTTPALICDKCGQASIYKAVKCTNPECGIVFLSGSVPNDFADRCPKCGQSEVEEIRKQRRRQD